MLEDQEIRAGGCDRRPKRLPVDRSGADIGPAVVLGHAFRRDVLDMEGGKLAGELREFGLDVAIAADNPAKVGLPQHILTGEQMLDRARPVGKRRIFESMIVPGELQPALAKRRGMSLQPGAERLPAVGVVGPLILRYRWHDHGLKPEDLRGVDDRGTVGVEIGEADMGRRTGQPEGIELLAEAGGIVAVGAAIGLDGVEADCRQRLEMGLDGRKIARTVELERYPIVHHQSDLLRRVRDERRKRRSSLTRLNRSD